MLESITKDLSLGREMNGHFLEGDWKRARAGWVDGRWGEGIRSFGDLGLRRRARARCLRVTGIGVCVGSVHRVSSKQSELSKGGKKAWPAGPSF